jgi:hypothetical protein
LIGSIAAKMRASLCDEGGNSLLSVIRAAGDNELKLN